jgi:hypothetical protein
MEKIGLAWNVYRVKESDLNKRIVPAKAEVMGGD